MNYHPEDFLALMGEVEEQGGAFLTRKCVPKPFNIRLPDYTGRVKVKQLYTVGCGNESLMVVPYKKEDGSVGTFTACAVDDDMGRWPRFQDVLQYDELPEPPPEEII